MSFFEIIAVAVCLPLSIVFFVGTYFAWDGYVFIKGKYYPLPEFVWIALFILAGVLLATGLLLVVVPLLATWL